MSAYLRPVIYCDAEGCVQRLATEATDLEAAARFAERLGWDCSRPHGDLCPWHSGIEVAA